MEKAELTALVRSVQAGEDGAAGRLYDAFQQDVYYFIRKTVDDPELAEDLTQDTFIEILQTIDKLQEPAAFVTWSRQIAYHRCTAHFRKRREILADEDADGYSVFDTVEEDRAEFIPDEALDQAELKKTIHAMIDALPEEQRSAIMMRYFDELSVKQIAQIQGVSEGTVKSRLNYGRKVIKQSVEDYEKKNGVKLRCAGVVPLLLWLFREYRLANGISLTASTAANAASAAAVDAGAKAVGTHLAAKIVAGVTAAALVTGGAIVALRPDSKPEPEPTKGVVQEEILFEWSGYGWDNNRLMAPKRYFLDIAEMDETGIRGHLEVTNLYEVVHSTDFTGSGTATDDGMIRYEIVCQEPAIVGTIPSYEYYEMPLTYDPETEVFAFTEVYHAELDRAQAHPKPVILAENAVWSGEGICDFCWPNSDGHQFEIAVSRMTETDIQGKLTVLNNGTLEHESSFSGRGYTKDGFTNFEIALEISRHMDSIGEDMVIHYFWLTYDQQTDTLRISSLCPYEFELKKNS